MVELGLAIAWGKPTFLFLDDFRRCSDSDVYPLNLMLFTGMPETGREAYWYGSVEDRRSGQGAGAVAPGMRRQESRMRAPTARRPCPSGCATPSRA